MAEERKVPVSLQELSDLAKEVDEIAKLLESSKLRERLREIKEKLSDPLLWKEDPIKFNQLLREEKKIERVLNSYQKLKDSLEALRETYELMYDDVSIIDDWMEEYRELQENLKRLKVEMLLNEEFDSNDAILMIHAGTGGTDAQDWAEMLMRMYVNWATKRKFKVKITDYQPGGEAGIKSAVLLIEGENAYGLLKGEAGTHRLVRLSPFNANHKRQTSFALVEVIPKIDDEIKIELKPSELKIETFKAGGHGGQHVNKNETAVRVTHLPTGITVVCSNERSQHQNKEIALRILKSRLFQLERKKKEEQIRKLKGYNKPTWGNQIRNYVLHPYKLVKDLRTGWQTSNVQAVLDGEIDDFIYQWLFWRRVSKSRGTEEFLKKEELRN